MPGGLFPDEAANGLDVNLMQSGHLQPFYERGNGREALFFYMLWGSVEAFGKGPWQHHAVSAIAGVLSVLMCFAVARRLFLMPETSDLSFVPPAAEDVVPESLRPAFNQIQGKFVDLSPSPQKISRATNLALLASFLMAVSWWHIVLSRTAFRAVLIPLFASLTIYFLLRAFQAASQKAKLLFAFLCGASFALGFYTYIAFRIMAPVLFMLLVWPLLGQLKQRAFWKTAMRYKFLALSFLAAFVIFIFPIGVYFYHNPASFVGRAGQVSIFNPELYTINGQQLHGKPPLSAVLPVAGEVFKTQILGFFTRGDLNWRQNISGYPFLSPLVSPFFGAGLAAMLFLAVWYFFAPNRRAGFWKYYLLMGWFFGMLLPVVSTAEGIPHGLRGIGVIPPVFIISAWALYRFGELVYQAHQKFWHRCEKCHKQHYESSARFIGKTVASFGLKLVVMCFVAALTLQAYFAYFVYAYNSPENFYYFRSDLTTVSAYLVSRCSRDHTYLVLDKFSVQTTDYLTSDPKGNFNSPCNVPYRQVDPENSWQLSGLKTGDQVVFTQSSIFDIKKFKAYHSEARLVQEDRNKFGQAELAVYEIKY